MGESARPSETWHGEQKHDSWGDGWVRVACSIVLRQRTDTMRCLLRRRLAAFKKLEKEANTRVARRDERERAFVWKRGRDMRCE